MERELIDKNLRKYTFMEKIKAFVHHVAVVTFGKRLYGEDYVNRYIRVFEELKKTNY